MATKFTIKTPQQLRDDWDAEIIANFPDGKPTLLVSFFRVLGRAYALLVHGLYLFLSKIADQIFVTCASAEYLDRHGSEYGVNRKPAEAATGNIDATGTNGTNISTGTQFQSEAGIFYEVTAGATIAAGTASLPVRSLTFGSTTNQSIGTVLTLVNPIAGVDSNATVDGSALTGGADREADDAFRQRILFKKRNPIQCGAPSDYVQWGLQVADVTRTFVYPKEDGLGTVRVRFMMDDKYSDGIPQAADVTAVKDYIDTVKPAQVDLFVSAPIAQPMNPDISITPDTPEVRTAVEASLQDLLIREAEGGKTIPISKIRQAVSNAVGESDNTVNSPAADVTVPSNAEIVTLGTVTFS